MTAAGQCRSCGHSELETVLSLGSMPLANALLTSDQASQPEPRYPLELAFCHDCSLVQLRDSIQPEQLFRDYPYFSSFSDTMVRSAGELAERLTASRRLDDKSLVVELASNDGYLLQHYKRRGVPVLGVEPARNIAAVAEQERGIPTLCEFFDVRLARQLAAEQQADVIHANNVLAHVPDENGFVEGIRLLLKAGGLAVVEVPYVKNMMDGCEFDTIYHEHLAYFSLTSLTRLFERHALTIRAVEQIPLHGGSLRLFVCHAEAAPMGRAVRNLLRQEAAWGVDEMVPYTDFARKVGKLKASLLARLGGFRQQGKRLAAYGAAAKGSTLLNYVGIGRETIDFVVDRSPYKQGLCMPGVHLPIHAPDTLVEAMPDYTLLLTWNFADEILEQQAEYRQRGGHFIIPVPEPRVV